MSSAHIVIENAFGQLKGRFCCLKRAMDIDINVLPQVIMACFVLHNYCEMKKEKLPEQNIRSSLNHEKSAQPSTKSLGYKDVVNENPVK